MGERIFSVLTEAICGKFTIWLVFFNYAFPNIKMFLKEKVMIVEDDETVSSCITMDLNRMGYKVSSTISNREDAIQAAITQNPDLILMDILLKGSLSGIDAAYEIRSKKDIPIIYTTSVSDDQILKKALATNPSGILIKPFRAEKLRSSIEVALQLEQTRKAVTDRKLGNIRLLVYSEKVNSESVRYALRYENNIKLLTPPKNFEKLVSEISKGKVDILLFDRSFFETDRQFLSALEKIKANNSKTKILVLISREYPVLRVLSIKMGVQGIVDETMSRSDFIKAVYVVSNNGTWFRKDELFSIFEKNSTFQNSKSLSNLTGKEKEVMKCAARCYSNKKISKTLFISENTVKTHLKNIYKKLGVSGKRELALKYFK